MEQLVIDIINDDILADYNVKIEAFSDMEERPNVLAFYHLISKKIYINTYNRLVFNDYLLFIEVMLHENAHYLNDMKGVEDVEDNGVHSKVFKDSMLEYYGVYCNKKDNGEIDIADKRNYDFLKTLLKEKTKHQETFEKLQKIYYEHIFKGQKDKIEEKTTTVDEEEKDFYDFTEEGGVEF